MTGIERLRAIAGAWDEWGLGGTLAEIADEIERELVRHDEPDSTDNGTRLLYVTGKERETLEWVRKYGGIGCVQTMAAKLGDTLNWIRERAGIGEDEVVDYDELLDALDRRLMPDSCKFQKSRKVANSLTSHSDASDVSMSAYDLLPQEERDAIAWVRKHGGIDHVRAEWSIRVPHDLYERRRQRLLDHIAECETALGRRNRRIEELGHRVSDLTRENAELRNRAMPEGMEWLLEVWPMWSNGEYCRFGDWWTADRYGDYEPRQLRRLVIYTPELLDEWEQGDGESYGYEWDFMRPSELGYRPDKAVAPEPAVLAADGEPLEVGQTVWDENGDELVIGALEDGGNTVACRYVDVGDGIPVHGMWSPSDLTHQRPDSWERLEEDAMLSPHSYICACGKHDDAMPKSVQMSIDLVRRARALAERERGE